MSHHTYQLERAEILQQLIDRAHANDCTARELLAFVTALAILDKEFAEKMGASV